MVSVMHEAKSKLNMASPYYMYPPCQPKLPQLRLSLKEKLETLRQLNGEIPEMTGDEKVENGIEQADELRTTSIQP